MLTKYKTTIITVSAVIAVIILGIFIVQGSKNKAINLEETVEQAKSDIDTQIDRKANLLTELAEVVKHYDEYEAQALINVIAARYDNPGGDFDATTVMNQIKVVAEAYPELKSQTNYTNLMNNISECENLLAQHKKAYNSAVKSYRTYTRSFPARMFLSMSGYETIQYELYESSNTDEALKLF